MMLFTCAAVGQRLQAFHDRELPIREMIDVEEHVHTCARCTRELRSMRAIGEALRVGAAPRPADDWIGLRWAVVGRMRAEAAESWPARAGRMFDDLHLIWVGLAATLATFICGAAALGAVQLASSDRDDSLAAMMAIVSAPRGSNLNPVRTDESLQVPRLPTSGAMELMRAKPISSGDDDVVLAFSAVVTREGRLARVSVLNTERQPDEILPILDVLSRATLEPGRLGSSPVAVNLIWLMAHTTVRPQVAPRAIKPGDAGPRRTPGSASRYPLAIHHA